MSATTLPNPSHPDLSLAERRRGVMLILSSPSGAGKTTLSKMLLADDLQITPSVSVTTRGPRPAEMPGRDYNFIDNTAFQKLVDEDRLLEHAEVYGNFYGTPRDPVEKALAGGQDVLFDIDWRGTQQMLRKARPDLVTIFILPPSMQELESRLRGRAQDSEEVIARRIAKAHDDVSHWGHYDYTIVNREIDHSFACIRAILTAERLKRERQVGMAEFVGQLQAGV